MAISPRGRSLTTSEVSKPKHKHIDAIAAEKVETKKVLVKTTPQAGGNVTH